MIQHQPVTSHLYYPRPHIKGESLQTFLQTSFSLENAELISTKRRPILYFPRRNFLQYMANLGQLIYNLPVEEKRIIRCIEKIQYKVNACLAAILFSSTCIREGLLPTLLIRIIMIISKNHRPTLH